MLNSSSIISFLPLFPPVALWQLSVFLFTSVLFFLSCLFRLFFKAQPPTEALKYTSLDCCSRQIHLLLPPFFLIPSPLISALFMHSVFLTHFLSQTKALSSLVTSFFFLFALLLFPSSILSSSIYYHLLSCSLFMAYKFLFIGSVLSLCPLSICVVSSLSNACSCFPHQCTTNVWTLTI